MAIPHPGAHVPWWYPCSSKSVPTAWGLVLSLWPKPLGDMQGPLQVSRMRSAEAEKAWMVLVP